MICLEVVLKGWGAYWKPQTISLTLFKVATLAETRERTRFHNKHPNPFGLGDLSFKDKNKYKKAGDGCVGYLL